MITTPFLGLLVTINVFKRKHNMVRVPPPYAYGEEKPAFYRTSK